MTGDRKPKTRGDLDIYFNSPRFLRRLDEIRTKSKDPIDLKAYAFSIAHKLGMLTIHIGVIWHYC